MSDADAREALFWTQGKLSLAQAIGEWGAMGAKVTLSLIRGELRGHIVVCGTDWLCLHTRTKEIFVPLSQIEYCWADIEPSPAIRPAAPTKDQSWVGCLRGLNTSGALVVIELASGRQLPGRIAVVTPDHLRLVQDERDDGALGPIIPVRAITCLWQQIPYRHQRHAQTGAENATNPRSHP